MRNKFILVSTIIMLVSLAACNKAPTPPQDDANTTADSATQAPPPAAANAQPANAPATDVAPAQAPDAPQQPSNGDSAKPSEPIRLTAENHADKATVKLEDLGLDIDYVLEDMLIIDNTHKLEIGPGVTIDMRSSRAGFEVRDDAALVVSGSETAPVVMKSTNASAWSGITLHSANKDNALNHLEITQADGEDDGIIRIYGRCALDHVTIDGSAKNGVILFHDARFTRFTNNTIKNCKGFPLVLDNNDHLDKLGDGNTFENNRPFIRLENSNFFPAPDMVIPRQPLPYYLAQGMRVDGESGTLTIQPGVELAIEHDHEIWFGGSIQVKLEGTPEAPIRIHGTIDEPDFWNGVKIDTARPSTLSHLTIANAGKDENASLNIRGSANVELAHVTFKANSHRCMHIDRDAKLKNKGGLSFENCAQGNIFDDRIEADDDAKKILSDLPVDGIPAEPQP